MASGCEIMNAGGTQQTIWQPCNGFCLRCNTALKWNSLKRVHPITEESKNRFSYDNFCSRELWLSTSSVPKNYFASKIVCWEGKQKPLSMVGSMLIRLKNRHNQRMLRKVRIVPNTVGALRIEWKRQKNCSTSCSGWSPHIIYYIQLCLHKVLFKK